MLLDQPKKWTTWLPLAQWYNTSFHRSIQITPFQALYGFPPPLIFIGPPPQSQIKVVDSLLRNQYRTLTQLH
jgi:hypothetical protein